MSALNRIVALKMILAGDLASARRRASSFRNEGRGRRPEMDHANIVPIYDVGEHRGWH